MRPLFAAFSVLFALLLPVVLISTNTRVIVNSHRFYEYGIDRYGAVMRIGLPKEELLKGARGIIDYFNNDQERLEVTVQDDGQAVPLFNEREILHMVDVKDLVQGAYTLNALAVALVAAYAVYAVLALAQGHPWAFRYTALALILGGGGTAALVAIIGGIAAVGGFQYLFLQFHLFSFSNLLWVLDPSTDRLIQMFPQGFFFDATMLIAGAAFLQGLVLAGAGLVLRWLTPQPASPGH